MISDYAEIVESASGPNAYLGKGVQIESEVFIADQIGHTCKAPIYEFNPPLYDRGRALWYGIPAVGELIVICEDVPWSYFDILNENELGYYLDGRYLILRYQAE